jgi:2-polyprenyl-3-methyl-5-hydroxy-6-metoxy-1,4-benzoquinol methylase
MRAAEKRTESFDSFVHYLTETRDCLICGGRERRPWAILGPFTAVECPACGFVWMDPYPSLEGLAAYYDAYIERRFEDAVRTRQRQQQYLIDRDYIQCFIRRGRVLDVGCTGGFFLAVLSEEFDKYGVEIDRQAVAYARRHYPFGHQVLPVPVTEAPWPAGSFDLVIMRGVIEHLPNPEEVMAKVSELLKPGGFFYVAATPNVDSFAARLYREKWSLFHPIRHLLYFGLETLSRFLSRYGLGLVSSYFPYLETPYADVERDHLQVLKALELKASGRFHEVGTSPPFWGSIMNAVYRKQA